MAVTVQAPAGKPAGHDAPVAFDVHRIRGDFPILRETVRGKPLVYLDNAATGQKPQAVIDAVSRYYAGENANVHRGVHYLSQLATERYEDARKSVARFLGVPLACQIIFTRGTTEALNLVAQSYGRQHVRAGDEVLVSHMEHHSNIVPWQMLCEQTGASLKVIPITDDGALDMAALDRLMTPRVKIVAVTHMSNALGTINPIREIAAKAHAVGAKVVVDGAQSTPHLPINVLELGCDFFAFSGHKLFAPTGVGVLYGRAELLESMPPWQGGGDMILSVTFEKTTYNSLPYKFEAGTPHIAGVVGLGAAVAYIEGIGREAIHRYEDELLAYATAALAEVPGLRPIGAAPHKAGVLSFTLESAHPHDVGQILDDEGVAIRAGHHCAQPVMQRFGVPATARASLAFYNTREDIDRLVGALHAVNKVFA